MCCGDTNLILQWLQHCICIVRRPCDPISLSRNLRLCSFHRSQQGLVRDLKNRKIHKTDKSWTWRPISKTDASTPSLVLQVPDWLLLQEHGQLLREPRSSVSQDESLRAHVKRINYCRRKRYRSEEFSGQTSSSRLRYP